MKIEISEAQERFEELVQLLIDGKEERITIFKDGEPVIQIVPPSKRIGAAKNEMNGFDISLEAFNSISIDDLGV